MSQLKIVTFNLRTFYDTYDGVNAFIHRAALILDKIDAEKPDVICFQEASDGIRKFLKKYLVDYNVAGHGRYKNFDGEGLCTAWRKDTMELYGLEQYWLSPTPDVPASKYEDQSDCPRTCVYTVLKKNDIATPFCFYNVHLDHIGAGARIEGMKQILADSNKKNTLKKFPTFYMGDFNATPDGEAILECTRNGLIDLAADLLVTFHNFEKESGSVYPKGTKIDYIFADAATAKRMKTMEKWEDNKNGIYLSDHYPICCVLEY